MKTFDLPITHNKLKTKEDVANSMLQILEPCGDALIEGNSGLFIRNNAAHYSPKSTLMEGWSRLLWGLVPLRIAGYTWKDQDKHFEGLINGTDPTSQYYWGPCDYKKQNQKIVEMAAISYALLFTPEYYWDPLTELQKDNLCAFLNQCNSNTKFFHNNWLYFRILVNLVFEKYNRKEFNEKLMLEGLDEIESMYAEDGWYHDYVPFDNYNPWAMQFYSIIYFIIRKDKDPLRCNKIEKRVKEFANQFIYYYNKDGGCVPYGRSLTYRFGVSCFFGACALANIEVLPWGVMKGIVLRNLRWWMNKPIFDRDGFLTIGYVNPTGIFAEQYNAEGSPYWGLKNYILLAVPKNHPFWTSEELPLPELDSIKLLKAPGCIMQRTTDDDVVMLNAGQVPTYTLVQQAEKYAKFAYSIHYGFSAATSYYDFDKCGCDNMLYCSEDGKYYRPRRELTVLEKTNNYVKSEWNPYSDVSIVTTIVPCGDYHILVHKIEAGRTIYTKEGGFAIARYKGLDIMKPIKEKYNDDKSSIAISLPWDISVIEAIEKDRVASFVEPTPNLNCNFYDVAVPYLSGKIEKGETKVYVSLVGASSKVDSYLTIKPKVEYDPLNEIIYINGENVKLV